MNQVSATQALGLLAGGLGLFLLGTLTRRVGQGAALTGLVAGLAVVSYVALAPKLPGAYRAAIYPFETVLAWPWYALVGSATVCAVGLLVSLFAAARLRRGGTPAAA